MTDPVVARGLFGGNVSPGCRDSLSFELLYGRRLLSIPEINAALQVVTANVYNAKWKEECPIKVMLRLSVLRTE